MMAASDKTVEKVIEVLRRHVSPQTMARILEDLKEVPGNKSFRDTIEKIARASPK